MEVRGMRSKSEMIEAMKQALEALECINSPLHMTELRSVGRAITALRAAIAEASMQRLTDVPQEMEATINEMETVEPVAWEAIEKIAQERYKVGPSDTSMFYRFAVLAGNGTQHLYIGREIECQNMARKFAGAFLDGAFLYEKMATSLTTLLDAVAQALADTQDWCELEALRESLREHMAEIHRLRAALAEGAMQRLTDVQQAMEAPRVNQCAEVCERAKLCAICARGLEEMEQDPVAWADIEQGAISWMKGEYGPTWKPLYTHPPRREWVGLTDEEIEKEARGGARNFWEFVAAIEAKLKEKNA